ncbi:putative repeat protein (TIGR01451 family) [Paenibacillus favisporus]|uniref:Repeat protein (TIGR01451 family) n=1 Tax=Paenibacillus favisporus TaxID=221028 RepID=A0ABV2EXU9_9BACL
MKSGLTSDFILKNQTMVRFSVGGAESVAYSNTVDTPWIGPLLKFSQFVQNSVVSLNQMVTYSFSIRNDGNREAGLILYDPLPAGLSFIPNSVLKNGAPVPGAHPGSGIDLGMLGPDASVYVVFQAIVVAIPPSLQITNEGRAEYTFQSLGGRTVRGSIASNPVTLSVLPSSVSLIADVSTYQTFIGDILFYELLVTNQGSVPLSKAVIFITLPPGLTFVQGSVVINDVLYPDVQPENGIPIGTIAPGASIRIRVSLRVGMVDTDSVVIQSCMKYYIDGMEYTAMANELQVNVIDPEVSLSKKSNRNRATIGCMIGYECTVQNTSSQAVDATLQDAFPQGLSLVPGSVRLNGQNLEGSPLMDGLFLGTLSPGQQVSITYEASVDPFIPSAAPLRVPNEATVSYAFHLPDGRIVRQRTSPDTAIVELLAPSLTATAHAAHYVLEPGDELLITVKLNNSGSLGASVVLVGWMQDPNLLQAGTVIVNGKAINPPHDVLLGSVDPGGSLTFRYAAKILDPVDGQLEEINGYFLFRTLAEVDGCVYEREWVSETISIAVNTEDE